MREGAQPGFLDDVLGFELVAENAPRDAKEPLVVAAQEQLEEITLSGTDPANDLLVSKNGRLWRNAALPPSRRGRRTSGLRECKSDAT